MSTEMFADLAVDTAVRADPDDPRKPSSSPVLPDHWDYLLPSGGVVMTCALRAAAAHISPEPPLRLALSATTIFASPINPKGELDCPMST